MRIQNVVFDLDGTLVDSAPDILDALRLAAAEARIETSIALTAAVIGPPVRGMLEAWGATFTPEQADVAVLAFRRLYDTCPMPNTTPYAGALQCIERLQGVGCRIFVATNKPELPTRGLLERYFPGKVEAFICTNSLPDQKLDKLGMLRELTRRYGLEPQRSVIVGDGASDLRAGKSLEWWTMAALYGYSLAEILVQEGPHWTVSSPDEIAERLLTHG